MPVMEGTFRNIIFSFILLFLIFGSTEVRSWRNGKSSIVCIVMTHNLCLLFAGAV